MAWLIRLWLWLCCFFFNKLGLARTGSGSCKTAVPNLPHELLAVILSKLPAKSLLRLRCVSKSWLSLISEPQFIKTHLKQSIEKILITTYHTNECLYTANIEAFDNEIIAHKLDYIIDLEPHDFPQIIGSHNGLLCLMFSHCSLYISNVSMRVSKQIPYFYMPHCATFHIHGFGYDHSVDDYKVLKGNDDGVYVYSLRADSWKRVIHEFPIDGMVEDSGIQFNGALHWLGSGTISKQPLTIVVFDLVDEFFWEIPLPDLSRVDFNCRTIKLGVFRGCLCILPMCGGEFLVMKEYGEKQSWTKIEIEVPHSGNVYPWVFLKNGEALLRLDHEKFVLYNTREGTYRDLVLRGIPGGVTSAYKDTYVDSLVSPIMAGETEGTPSISDASADATSQWCQRWTITLTGVLMITGSWLVFHSAVVTVVVLSLISAWWYLSVLLS